MSKPENRTTHVFETVPGCFRVKGGSTKFYAPVTGDEPKSATLGVIVQSKTVRHPREWPCRQLGRHQLELDKAGAAARAHALKEVLASALDQASPGWYGDK